MLQVQGLKQTVAPTVEPVSLADAKLYGRIDTDADDATINTMIRAARMQAEEFTRRAFVNQTWALYLASFPFEIIVPKPPYFSTTSIQYVDTNGDTQTLASTVYQADEKSEPGRIREAYQQSWPATRVGVYNAVTLTYVAGYGTAEADVPEGIREAIMRAVQTSYEFREDLVTGTIVAKLPKTAKDMLAPYRVEVYYDR